MFPGKWDRRQVHGGGDAANQFGAAVGCYERSGVYDVRPCPSGPQSQSGRADSLQAQRGLRLGVRRAALHRPYLVFRQRQARERWQNAARRRRLVVYGGTAGGAHGWITAYLDGNSDGSVAFGTIAPDPSVALMAGARYPRADPFLSGEFQEVNVYPRALDAEQLRRIARGERAGAKEVARPSLLTRLASWRGTGPEAVVVTGEVVGAETVPEPEGRLSEQQPGEDVGAETVPEPGGRLPKQQPGDWLSLENGRRGAVQVVDNVVQGSGVDSHPALARGCLPAGVCCAWRVTLLSDDYYYVGVATSEVSLSGWLGGNGDVRSIYLRDDKKGTRAVTRPQYRKEECGQRLKAGNFIDFSYDGRRSLTAICRDAMGKVVGDHRFELGRGPYFIALAGNLQLGDNETAVHYGASFKHVWTLGCDATEGPVSIWRPEITAPYVFFGDSVVRGGSAPRYANVTMRDDEVDTVPPVGFRRIADQQRGGEVYIWEPVPPSPDDVALGDVATLSAKETDPAKDFPRLRCAARRRMRSPRRRCRCPPKFCEVLAPPR